MDASSRYWQICRLSLANHKGYEYREISTAKEYCREGGSLLQFLTLFSQNSALAGLCLRCYVSFSILKATRRIASLFAGNHNFTYRDLLPFVLNDDGKRQIILDADGKTQLAIDSGGNPQPIDYKFFTVDILATYKSDESSMSLDNWAFLQTKQNKELKQFLAEFGFQHLSDWAMLNRVGVKQLSLLADRDRHLVEVFHLVYRRDRRQQKSKTLGKCPDPTLPQLKEMQTLLRSRNWMLDNTEILNSLKRIVQQLRQYDIWNYREPLEVYEPETGNYTARTDLPAENDNDALATEERELLTFLRDLLDKALDEAIAHVANQRVTKLTQSRKYKPFADKFVPGLQLYYQRKMSLKEIVPVLKLGNWDRARRILNPGDYLNSVRTQTIQQLLESIIQKTKDLGLTSTPPSPNYLQNLSVQIEAFADEAVFQTAAAEIKAGKNRDLKSIYAERVRLYCQKTLATKPAEQ